MGCGLGPDWTGIPMGEIEAARLESNLFRIPPRIDSRPPDPLSSFTCSAPTDTCLGRRMRRPCAPSSMAGMLGCEPPGSNGCVPASRSFCPASDRGRCRTSGSTSGKWKRSRAELVRHRQTKGSVNVRIYSTSTTSPVPGSAPIAEIRESTPDPNAAKLAGRFDTRSR